MEQQIFKYRQQARFIIEAVTPLALSNGLKDVMTDAQIATDVNGLPYLPGTTIAGIFRSMLAVADNPEAKKGETYTDKLFGWQEEFNNEGEGSRIVFSEGKILNSKGEVIEGICNNVESDPLLKEYLSLPIRQHAKIGPAGTTVETGKFDEQVVFAGTRFCFQIELISETEDSSQLEKLVGLASNISFRIGGGSRKGFGKIKVIKAGLRTFNLTDVEQLKKYLNSSSMLENKWAGWKLQKETSSNDTTRWVTYTLHLHSDSFFLFGSGMGDVEGTADMSAVVERKVEGHDNNRTLSDPYVLIPASSIKGALAHRVAYHYNRLNKWYFGNPEAKTGDENEAVRCLFGSNTGEISRGNVLMADIMLKPIKKEKLINHVSIDQFTGGAMAGALFTEKASFQCQPFDFTLHVSTDAFAKPKIKVALEEALKDIYESRLPLGGGVNRGQGVFVGTYESNLK